MESIEPRIVAAIAGAITAYTQKIELRSVSEEKKEALPTVEPINLWGIAGRQDLMFQRRLWQLRLCK